MIELTLDNICKQRSINYLFGTLDYCDVQLRNIRAANALTWPNTVGGLPTFPLVLLITDYRQDIDTYGDSTADITVVLADTVSASADNNARAGKINDLRIIADTLLKDIKIKGISVNKTELLNRYNLNATILNTDNTEAHFEDTMVGIELRLTITEYTSCL